MQWISMFENGFTLPGSDVQILTLFQTNGIFHKAIYVQ